MSIANKQRRLEAQCLQLRLSDHEFRRIQLLVRENFGIQLTDQNRELVVNRLHRHVGSQGFCSYDSYLDSVERDTSGVALDNLAGLITTNHTHFFRESSHFDYLLSKALPEIDRQMQKHGGRDLRVWCAGASSGQEAYTIAMCLMEYFGHRYGQLNVELLATDISKAALDHAAKGIYPAADIARLPEQMSKRYVQLYDDTHCIVSDTLRKQVLFRRFNLVALSYPFKESFHIVFFRNVMIYLDDGVREAILSKLYRVTTPGGYLFVGHAESYMRSNPGYDYVAPAVYRKVLTV